MTMLQVHSARFHLRTCVVDLHRYWGSSTHFVISMQLVGFVHAFQIVPPPVFEPAFLPREE